MAQGIMEMFGVILNMSLGAALAALGIMGIRIFLKKAPRKFLYFLWIVVLIRMIIPQVPEMDFGMIPSFWKGWQAQEYAAGLEMQHSVQMQHGDNRERDSGSGTQNGGYLIQSGFRQGQNAGSGIGEKNSVKEKDSVQGADVSFLKERIWFAVSLVWLLTVVGLLSYEIVAYCLFMKRLRSIRLKGKIYGPGKEKWTVAVCKEVRSPFTAGVIHPVIYLPETLREEQRRLILEHEEVHIRRGDNCVKPLVAFLLCVHWFNPVLWLSARLMEKDMEMSCDEAVLSRIGYDRKKEYALTLLESAGHSTYRPIRLAFGESSIEERIKNVMKKKKAKTGVILVTGILVCAASAMLLVNGTWNSRKEQGQDLEQLKKDYIVIEDQVKAEDPPREEEQTRTEDQVRAEDSPREEEQTRTEDQSGVEDQIQAELVVSQEKQYKTAAAVGAPEGEDPYHVLLRNISSQEEPRLQELVDLVFADPVAYSRISDTYGEQQNPVTGEKRIHSGIDFAAPEGTQVWAAADGTVYETGFDPECGNYVILQHETDAMSYYSHLKEIFVEEGQELKCGDAIATVGNTGKSTGAHLHFAVSREGEFIKPISTNSEWEKERK